VKKRIKVLAILIFSVVGLFKLIEWRLESKFEAILNSEPDRDYNISYQQIDLHTFFSGITLEEVSITPLNKFSGTIINANVDFIELDGFKWLNFLFAQQVEINVLEFKKPRFIVNTLSDTGQEKNSSNFQKLFGDILSRIDLMEFKLHKGSIKLLQKDTIHNGNISGINIYAAEIETDSVQLSHIIPFYLKNLEASVDSASFNINTYTKAKMGAFAYSLADESFGVKNLSLKYDKDWIDVSKIRGVQDDVIEFDLKELKVSKMKYTSSFWTNLDIEAQQMLIDGLSLKINRNKNLNRPPEREKPLFNKMVEKIPYNIDLDSIHVKHSSIAYGELAIDRQTPGIITINAINGTVTQLTTFEERQQKLKEFKSSFTAKLNDAAAIQVDLDVPYHRDYFDFRARIGPMPLKALNKSLTPLLGVEFNDGHLKRLDFRMRASYYESSNSLEMDYDNMHLKIYEEESNGTEHEKDFLTSIANVAIRQHNLPENNDYIKANYNTQRNIYRSPVQHIVDGVLDGAKQIVPVRLVQTFIKTNDSKRKIKKKRKNRKRKIK
jgi:hypothetical protein